jgi:hypothetical protein
MLRTGNWSDKAHRQLFTRDRGICK